MLGSLRRPLVAPLATRVRDLPTQVRLYADDGPARPCVAALDNVQPLAASLLVERVSSLGLERTREVCQALAIATDCE